MDENDHNPKIATLIFMDLETTGLPFDVGKKNVHITEMSFVAIDRNNFEEDRNLRILNKLSLCIRPRSVVSPGAMHITGLYNDILENQEQFDESIPKLLEYFFRRLQAPVCLLAHNGNSFDFPVLQAELKRINYSLGPNVLCADTLVAFRSICLSAKLCDSNKEECQKAEKTAEVENKNPDKDKCEDLSANDIDKLLSEDLDDFVQLNDPPVLLNKNCSSLEEIFETPLLEQGIMDVDTEKKIDPSSDFLPRDVNEKTPVKSTISFDFNIKRNLKKRKLFDPAHTSTTFRNKQRPPAKRSLFSEASLDTFDLAKIKKFTLENLYTHFFNKRPPQSHYAEGDCISLSKVCQKIDREFLKWIDENSTAFCSVNALW